VRKGDSITDFDAFKASDGIPHSDTRDRGTNFAAFERTDGEPHSDARDREPFEGAD
jgi:hypothetical protein